MISALEWVPAGVADPSPKKYEFSPAELELIQLMENQHLQQSSTDDEQAQPQQAAEAPAVSPDRKNSKNKKKNGGGQNIDDDDEDDGIPKTPASSPQNVPQQQQQSSSKSNNKDTALLPPPTSSLPADLRMDEYSSDEDDDEGVNAKKGTLLGQLLVEGEHPNDEDVYDEAMMESNDNHDDDKQPGNKAKETDDDDDDDMEDDDDDDDDDDFDERRPIEDTREYMPIDIDGLKAMGLSNVASGTAPSYMDDDNDNGDGIGNDDDNDDDSDAEDVQIRPNDDAVIVIAKTEDDFAALEVHVYEQDTGNLFVHHDIPLPAFPLCLAHGDISPAGTAGNYCVVGTFGTGIEVWNLDVLNALEPSCVLGGEDTSMADEIMRHNMMNSGNSHNRQRVMTTNSTSSSRGGGGGGGPSLKPGSHTDAVMALSWNKVHRQVIASGSADQTVKLWDVTQAHDPTNAIAGTLSHHKDKVQSVVWHPVEGTLLATGSYDRTVCLIDARQPHENIKRAKLPADCEALVWDPHNPQYLTAATEDGTLTCFDVRKFNSKKPLWSIVASEYGGVSDLSYNPYVPGMLATCSVDETVTLWDTYTNVTNNTTTTHPISRMSKDMKVGKLYTVNFYPSSPWLLGCAGGAKEMALWDMTRDDVVQKCFAKRLISKEEGSTTAATSNNTSNENDDTTATISSQKTKEAFDAMMAGGDEKEPTSKKKEKGKKNNKKKKKKVHRAGR